MKLKLTTQHDVQILSVTEGVSGKDAHVLTAGIRKLFQNGKNKIALELPEGAGMSDDAIRELALLDALARELAGRVILVCGDAQTRKKIETFSKPPLIQSVATLKEALAAFAPKPLDAAKKPAPAPAPAKPAAQPAAAAPAPAHHAPGTTPEAIAAEKAALRERELGDLGTLRERVAELENENKILLQQLAALVWERHQPVNAPELQARIETLESELEKLVATPQTGKK